MRIFNRFPLVSRVVAFLVFPALLAGFLFYQRMENSLPKDNMTLAVKGVAAPVELMRDRHGVMYIAAMEEQDIYFAMGFAHASDRLWQLELQRRLARGEMSELFGRGYLNQDVFMRTLGIFEATESAWDTLTPEARSSLESYSAGIAAWLDVHSTLPIEFTLFNIKPEKWTPRDSLAWIKVLALSLSGNMYSEITKAAAKQMLPPPQFNDLYPAPSDLNELSRNWIKPNYADFLSTLTSQKEFNESVLKIGGINIGSNGWVIAGRHTKSGQPILANDPHLGLQIPSPWYVVSQSSPTFNAAGMSLVGLPIVVLGRNDSIAWGATNLMADVQDLYIERLHPQDPNLYLSADGLWKEFKEIEKIINVRADFPSILREAIKPIRLRVRHSENGPVVSELNDSLDFTISLSWTALKQNDTSYEAFFQMTHANNWLDFKKSAGLLHAPALNMLYVDTKNIGYLAAGQIPIRGQGDGTEPVPGWMEEYQWKGYIPALELPQKFNPPSGIIVSANANPTDGSYPYLISSEWALPLRANRIEKLILDHIKLNGYVNVENQKTIQQDQFDGGALALIRSMTELQPEQPRLRALMENARSWDGQMHSDSQAALLFAIWLPELNRHLFEDEFDRGFLQKSKSSQLRELLPSIPYTLTLDALHQKTRADWCNDAETEIIEKCVDILNKSFQQAVLTLDKYLGKNVEHWTLSAVQNTSYEHIPFSHIKLFENIFGRNISNGGSGNSINVAPAIFDKENGLKQKVGASFRQIIAADGEESQHLYMNSTGQSGNVFSDYYDDMVEPFNSVSFYQISPSVPKLVVSRYHLIPLSRSDK